MFGCSLGNHRPVSLLPIRNQISRQNRQPPTLLAPFFKKPTPRIARWILKLQKYQLDIVHGPGSSNLNANTLSRMPLNAVFFKSDKSVTELRQRQESDPDLNILIQALEGQFDQDPAELFLHQRLFLSRLEEFQLHESVLVRISDCKNRAVLQVVVPKSMKREILHEFHDDPTGGHLSRHKMLGKIRSRYYWPNLDDDVKQYCRLCLECQKLKPPQVLPIALMQPIKCSRHE